MLYGILLESCRDGISIVFGQQTWKRIVQELSLGHETFTILGSYDENLIERIAECKSFFTFLYLRTLRESPPKNRPEDRHLAGEKSVFWI